MSWFTRYWVNFHICWKRACVKDLTNIMSESTHATLLALVKVVNYLLKYIFQNNIPL